MQDKPLIVPIIIPQIDWGTYIDVMTKVTGQSPTRILDFNHKSIGPVSSFLFTLGAESWRRLDQCSYTFLMELTDEESIQIIQESRLKLFHLSDSAQIYLISGTVKEWKEACLEFCVHSQSFNLRYLFDCAYIYFNQLGLFQLIKIGMKDETFTLHES